jgi:hypothetical protein
VIAQYSTIDQRDQHAVVLRSLLGGLLSEYYLLIGENWLINVGSDKDLANKLATTFSAAVVVIPQGMPSEPDSAAAGLQAARLACSHYVAGVAPVIVQAVAANNGALIIRVSAGEPPDGGSVDPNAPWFLTNDAAITAASYDGRYSALTGRLDALDRAILAISPFQMSATLASVASAGQSVQQYCTELG